ncbi:hypothetical protein LTR70_005302 [Exophiala xenobiotica]|nr:hypothetical protein LTR70_005302 [Exophiala xenobiotica]
MSSNGLHQRIQQAQKWYNADPEHSARDAAALFKQPFAIIKGTYAQVLRYHDPTGLSPISRAEFNVIYAQARGVALTQDNITAGWRHACLHPRNVNSLIYKHQLDQVRPTTPDLQPQKTLEYRTLKRKSEWKPIIDSLRRAVPDSHVLAVTRIEHHLEEVTAELTVLRQQIRLHRKEARTEEIAGVHKRLKKTNDKIITSFEDLGRAREGAEDEIALLVDQQPSVFKLMTDKDTHRRIRKRAAKKSSNIAAIGDS